MAIDRTGISSLQTGAPEITYTGDQGPKSPDQELMASADPMLVEEYNKYVFEMEEQGLQPISFREFIEQIMSEARQGGAGGGIMRLGYRGGQLVKPGPGRPGYQGRFSDTSPMSPGTSATGGTHAGGYGRSHDRGGDQHRDQAAAVVQAAKDQAAEVTAAKAAKVQDEINKIKNSFASDVVKTQLINDIIDQPMLGDTGGSMDYMSGVRPSMLGDTGGSMDYMLPDDPRANPHDPSVAYYTRQPGIDISVSEDAKTKLATDIQNLQDIVPPGSTAKDYVDIYRDPTLVGDTTDTGGTNVPGTPIVPAGITAAESAQSFQDAKAAEIAKVQAAAAASGAPFEHYYVGGDPTAEQEKFMREHQAAASMVGREAWPAAYGGRVPAAFGGIMDSATGRRGYFLGSVAKAVGKAAKAVGKVLKSPVGMMALTGVLGGLPMFAGLGGAGAPKMSAWQKWIGPALMGSPAGKGPGPEQSRLTGGLLNWIKGNPMKSIGLLSTLPFLTQGKGEDEPSWAGDYGLSLIHI